jgi:hypothetical protein
MGPLVRLFVPLVVLASLGACVHRRHHDDDVVVESETLETLGNGCIVRGSIRNDDDHTLRVFLSWRAFDRDGDRIGTADAEVRDLPRDQSRDFESTRFREFDGDLIRCDRIARIRHSTSAFRD